MKIGFGYLCYREEFGMKTVQLKKNKSKQSKVTSLSHLNTGVRCCLPSRDSAEPCKEPVISFAVVGPDLEHTMQDFVVTGFSVNQQFPDDDTETSYWVWKLGLCSGLLPTSSYDLNLPVYINLHSAMWLITFFNAVRIWLPQSLTGEFPTSQILPHVPLSPRKSCLVIGCSTLY